MSPAGGYWPLHFGRRFAGGDECDDMTQSGGTHVAKPPHERELAVTAGAMGSGTYTTDPPVVGLVLDLPTGTHSRRPSATFDPSERQQYMSATVPPMGVRCASTCCSGSFLESRRAE